MRVPSCTPTRCTFSVSLWLDLLSCRLAEEHYCPAVAKANYCRSSRRSTRNPRGQLSLMGVTKTVAPQQIREAYDAGLRIFGENRVQEFATKG